MAGSRHVRSHDDLPEPTRTKKSKRKRSDISDYESAQSEDSDAPPKKRSGHGGRRAGAGNYQEQDLKELLRLVEKELPMGQRGWKRIHEKYAVWATAKGRPVREWKLLESKFKNVCEFYITCLLFFSNLLSSLSKPRSRQEVAGAPRVLLVPKPLTNSSMRRQELALLTTRSTTRRRSVMETHQIMMSQNLLKSTMLLLALIGPKLLYPVALVCRPRNSFPK